MQHNDPCREQPRYATLTKRIRYATLFHLQIVGYDDTDEVVLIKSINGYSKWTKPLAADFMFFTPGGSNMRLVRD